MGKIEVHDGTVSRTIPVETLAGVITIDLSEDPTVTLPPDVEVQRSEPILE